MNDGAFARAAADICHAVARGDDAQADALALMQRSVASEFGSFSALSLEDPTDAVVIEHGRAPLSVEERADWERLLETHPYAHHVASAPRPANRLTDVVDMPTFQDTEVYQVCLEPSGLRYQAAFRLSRDLASFSLISLWRTERDFTDEELRPAAHFSEALRAAMLTNSALGRLAAESNPVEDEDRPLTARQTEVVWLVARGLTNQQIASHLGVTPRTVRKHVEDLFRRTGARSRTELAVRWTSSLRRRPGVIP